MAFTTNTGALSTSVTAAGVHDFAADITLSAAALANALADAQAGGMTFALPGIVAGGPVTAASLTLTIPAALAYFARTTWTNNAPINITVADNQVTYLWGCSDGVTRTTSTTTPPIGFTASTACILAKATASGGVITLDAAAVHQSVKADATARTLAIGGVTFAVDRVTFAGLNIRPALTKVLADADTTLTAAEYAAPALIFTGTLTAARNVILPLVAGLTYTVTNNTAGGFALTVKGATGTGVAIAATKTAIVFSDGTQVIRATLDA